MRRRPHYWIDHTFARLARHVTDHPVGRGLRERLDVQREVSRPRIALGRGHADVHGLRVAFLSDVHAGYFMSEVEIARICEQVSALAPDLVALGGDLINLHPEEAGLWRKGLDALVAPLGVFAVPGNHEYYAESDLRMWRDVFERAGVGILVNEGVRIRRGAASLWLAGVDDLVRGRPDPAAALAGARDDEPRILLSHNPDVFPEAARCGADLQLSGHTHGGQILLGGWTPSRQTRRGYWSGLFHRDRAQLYVGRGVGVSVIPLRFGAPGEIVLAELTLG